MESILRRPSKTMSSDTNATKIIAIEALRRWVDDASASSNPYALFPKDTPDATVLCNVAASQLLADFATSVQHCFESTDNISADVGEELKPSPASMPTSTPISESSTRPAPATESSSTRKLVNDNNRRPRRLRKRITPSRVCALEASTLCGKETRYQEDTVSAFARTPSLPSGSRLLPDRSDPEPTRSEPCSFTEHANNSAADGESPMPDISLNPCCRDMLRSFVANPLLKRRATLHANCITMCVLEPGKFSSALITLADALRLAFRADSAETEYVFSGIFSLGFATNNPWQLTAHAAFVIASMDRLVEALPAPIRTALFSNCVLAACLPDVFGENSATRWKHYGSQVKFPVPKTKFRFSRGMSSTISTQNGTSQARNNRPPHRLVANAENVWDKVLELQRVYRGDLANVAPGRLDRVATARCIGDLHPANMDAFALRFVNFLVQSVLNVENAPHRLKRLSARLTARPSSGNIGHNKYSSTRSAPAGHPGDRFAGKVGPSFIGKTADQGTKQMGVVLHRLPESVRNMFSSDASEMFFLEFIDYADSAKLNAALAPRFALALYSSIDRAAAALNDAALVDAILECRLCAKFLSVTMHIGNWAHSSLSFSGDTAMADENFRANSLPLDMARVRAAACSPMWEAFIDLPCMLLEAIQAKHACAVLAGVLVGDVMLRMAVADPVASLTLWFKRGVDCLENVSRYQLLSSDGSAWLSQSCGVLIRCTIDALFATLQAYLDEGIWSGSALCRDRVCSYANEDFVGKSILSMPDETSSVKPLDVPRRKVAGSIDAGLVGDLRLVQTCVPGLEEFRRRLIETELTRSPGCERPRRITPHAADEEGEGSLQDGGTQLRGTTRVEEVDLKIALPGCTDAIDNDAQAGGHDIQLELWREFHRTLDSRVGDLATLAAASRKTGAKKQRSLMNEAADLLLPEVPKSVIRVAAEHFFRRPGSMEEEVPAKSDQDVTCSSGNPEDRSRHRAVDNLCHEVARTQVSESISKITNIAWGASDIGSDVADLASILNGMGVRAHRDSASSGPSEFPGFRGP